MFAILKHFFGNETSRPEILDINSLGLEPIDSDVLVLDESVELRDDALPEAA